MTKAQPGETRPPGSASENEGGGGAGLPLWLPILCVVAATGMFVFDLSQPLGVAAGLPYVALVLLGLWSPHAAAVPVLAVVGIALTVLGYVYSPLGGIHWMVLTNRGLAIAAILTTAALAMRHHRALIALKNARTQLERKVERRTAELRTTEGALRDMSDRRGRAEDMLREREEWLRLVTDALPILIAYIDKDQRWRLNNTAYETWFGVSRDELFGMHMAEGLGDAAFEAIRGYVEQVLAGETVHYEALLPFSRGGARYVSANYVPYVDRNGEVQGFFSTVADITPRRQAEEALKRAHDELEQSVAERTAELTAANAALRESEERLKHLLAVAPMMVFVSEPTGNFPSTFVSDNVETHLGYQARQFIEDPAFWLERVHPDDAPRILRDLPRLFDNDEHAHEYRFRNAGGEYRWMRAELRLIRDAAGEPTEIVGSWTDITRVRQDEERLRRAQNMEAIGQLTGGVAHEFNNLLAVVSGNLELVAEGASGDKARRYVDNARIAADRGARLTHRLLSFSRQQPLDPQSVDVNALVAGMRDLLRPALGAGVEIETVLPAYVWPAHVDAAQLEAALLSIAVNAQDAMPEGGRMTVTTDNFDLSEASTFVGSGDLAAGPYVAIAVTDTGSGMAPGIAERAFDPFFTTKDVGRGTGLGLSMVHGFAKQSGGHVEIESEEGQGVTVRLYLPRAASPPAAEDPSDDRDTARVQGRGETILVVEDDPAVRRVVVEMLVDLGYATVEADSHDMALQSLAATPDIALLFTDVILPGDKSGFDIAREAAHRRPGIKVLFATGYSEEVVAGMGMPEAGAEMMFKPFLKAELAQRVADLLGH